MDELVIMKDQQAVTSSLQVAEAFEKQHKDVLEAISNKIQSAENSAHYKTMFAEGEYKDSRGRNQKLYYMNRDGFTFIAMGFTGQKADGFKLKYIDAFNKMESHIKSHQVQIPNTPQDALRLMFLYQEDTTKRVDMIEGDLHEIKENQLLCGQDYQTISKMVQEKVGSVCRQQHLNRQAKSELFRDLNGGIKKITGAVARNRIKAKQFDHVIEFINNWQPSTATLTIIRQMELIGDE